MTTENLITAQELIDKLKHAKPDDKVMIGPVENAHHLSVYRVRHPDNGTVYIELNEIVKVTHS